jgi:hypothetical protein
VALRVWIPARASDYAAFALVASGTIGMVAHFWIENYSGMAWSALTVGTGILVAGAHVVWRLRGARLPAAVTAHIVLAFANVLGAAALGVLIGFDKTHHFLPGFVLANVFAHAHLAALGWASLMVVGVAYRMLPMVLPAQMPSGPRLWVSAVLLETGVIALVVTLLLRAPFAWIPGAVVVAGFAAFLSQVAWMVRRPRPRPPGLRTPDPAVVHAAASFASLAIAAVLGLWLAAAESTPAMLRVATAYGVFGLVGFLAQIVVGMEGRLLPIFAWYWAYANTGFKGPVPPPHDMPIRGLQLAVVPLWLAGVPTLAAGLAFDRPAIVSAAAALLLGATALDTISVVAIVRHAFIRRVSP